MSAPHEIHQKSSAIPVEQVSMEPGASSHRESALLYNQLNADAQNQLNNALSENKAKSANGIIVNPINGEILAMASIPDFDLNNYNKLQKDSASYYFINRPVSSAYEPGSTFKIVCFIEGIENDLNNKKEKYFCENGFYKGRLVKDLRKPIKEDEDQIEE